LSALDEAIARGRFSSRAAALREGLARLLREEREREIEEAYRRGYGAKPQEDWIGEAGLRAGAELIAQDRPSRRKRS